VILVTTYSVDLFHTFGKLVIQSFIAYKLNWLCSTYLYIGGFDLQDLTILITCSKFID